MCVLLCGKVHKVGVRAEIALSKYLELLHDLSVPRTSLAVSTMAASVFLAFISQYDCATS